MSFYGTKNHSTSVHSLSSSHSMPSLEEVSNYEPDVIHPNPNHQVQNWNLWEPPHQGDVNEYWDSSVPEFKLQKYHKPAKWDKKKLFYKLLSMQKKMLKASHNLKPEPEPEYNNTKFTFARGGKAKRKSSKSRIRKRKSRKRTRSKSTIRRRRRLT